MKKINRKIDMFCYKHPHFGIPNLMMYITLISLAMWLFSVMDRSNALMSFFTFSPGLILKGQVWRLVTFIFVPQQSQSLWTLLFFYFYYWIGGLLEREWGTPRFNIFILSGIVFTVVFGFILYFITGGGIMDELYISVSYIYLSMFFSFATLFPDMQVLFMFILPVKVKWIAYIDAAFFVYEVFATPFPYGLLPVVALLNYLIFFGDELLRAVIPSKASRSKTTINFRRERAKAKYEQKTQSYTRKCSVCGRTDTDYPGLEFRYCSRCAGYHCFCIDHINNHVHFTE